MNKIPKCLKFLFKTTDKNTSIRSVISFNTCETNLLCVPKGCKSFVGWIQNKCSKFTKQQLYFLDYRDKSSVTCQIIKMHGVSFPLWFFKSLASVSPLSEPLRLSACRRVTHFSPLLIQTSPTLLNVWVRWQSHANPLQRLPLWASRPSKKKIKKNRSITENGDQHHHLVAVSSIA